MIDKSVSTLSDAIAGIHDGATIMIGGFGPAGQPTYLIDALIEQGARELTIINNNAGNGEVGLAALLKAGRVRKMVCSFPRQVDSQIFDDLYRRGKVELELVPQGTSRRESRPPAPVWARYLPRPATARRWLKAKRPAKSTVVITSSNTRSRPILP
jgi:3-oxoadipate CoA-transferase alpha subunit